MSLNYDMSELFGLEIENLKITDSLGLRIIDNEESLVFAGEINYEPKNCEYCGIKNDNHSIIKDGFTQTTVYMGLVFDRPAYIKLKKPRFYCKNCGHTLIAKTPDFNTQ
ncbi:transposase family protein [Staphylococcus canis]|uniref:transposase family protein n=1 Tax=Staphylococcus canis TaxID=2724942 RepID=UPI001E3493B2|nr:transposase family protein [Staphylococcus canis]